MNINPAYVDAMSRVQPGTFVPDVGAAIGPRTEAIPDGASDQTAGGAASGSFRDTVKAYLDQLDDQMATANQNMQDLATGKTNDVTNVVTSVEKASLSMELAIAMQNKLLSAYNEVSEMQM